MRLRTRLGCLLFAAIAGLSFPSVGSAQTTDDLFDARQLHEIRLWINSRDLAALRVHFDQNTFYPADLHWGDLRVRNVGVRSRGLGSRNPVKLGLLIDVDYYTTGQQFVGLTSLVLDNIWQDPSMLREFLTMSFFRHLGQPVPREAFTRLFINEEYQGLYAVVEDIDAAFVGRVTGDQPVGTLFEYHWQAPFFGEDLGNPTAYEPLFEPRTHLDDAPSVLWGPIHDLWAAVNDPDEAGWRTRVDEFLDLNQMVTQLAIEIYLAENDGLAGYAGMDNFYLYREPGGRRHRIFPWDKDSTFLQFDFSLRQGIDTNRLLWRSLAEPDLMALFLDVLTRCASVDRESAWLANRIEETVALVAPAIADDRLKPVSNEDVGAAVDHLRDFATRRWRFVLEQAASLRPRGTLP
ncbi:MAG: CotH kinase family protein [Vicinamibacterales bacterium]